MYLIRTILHLCVSFYVPMYVYQLVSGWWGYKESLLIQVPLLSCNVFCTFFFFLISLQINTRYHNALSSYTGSTAGEIQLMGMTCPLVEPLAA